MKKNKERKKDLDFIKKFRYALLGQLACLDDYTEIGIYDFEEKVGIEDETLYYFGIMLTNKNPHDYIFIRCYGNGDVYLEERVFSVNLHFNAIKMNFLEDFDEAIYQSANFIKNHP